MADVHQFIARSYDRVTLNIKLSAVNPTVRQVYGDKLIIIVFNDGSAYCLSDDYEFEDVEDLERAYGKMKPNRRGFIDHTNLELGKKIKNISPSVKYVWTKDYE